jgi:4-amino-4-deoxy-L-arabinose transferase-like glycosyltransferase
VFRQQNFWSREPGVALIFGVILAAMIVRVLIAPPIWHHGEAREGLVVRGILANNQWVLPRRNHELPSKPPLFHWMAAMPALLAGVSDFTVRLPSVLGGLVMAVTAFVLAKRMGGPVIGWLAVGALLGMYEFWDTAMQARVDMVFSACIAVSLAGFYCWYASGHKAARAAFYVGATLAVLAKGPAGLVLLVFVVASFLTIEKRWDRLQSLWSWPLVGAMLVIDIGWYVSAYGIGGGDFIKLQIQRENLDRLIGSEALTDRKTVLTMASWLVTRTFPVGVVLFWSVIRWLRGTREDSAGRFLHAWWMSIFVVFAFAAGKRAVYLLPIYPAIAILAARALGPILARSQSITRGEISAPASGATVDGFPRLYRGRAILIGIVLFDSVLMLAGRGIWKDEQVERTRLAFLNRLSAIVPAERSLFAAPDLGETELVVIAYRLGRDIERKPIACGVRNEYFLAPFVARESAPAEAHVIASSKMHNISLVELSEKPAVVREDCYRKTP